VPEAVASDYLPAAIRRRGAADLAASDRAPLAGLVARGSCCRRTVRARSGESLDVVEIQRRGVLAQPGGGVGGGGDIRFGRKAEQVGDDLPIAITLGNEPVISIVASTPMEYDQNEYELAGALRGEPAPITKSPLHGLPVPWGSEVVIEGVIEARKREIEGPFGEFTGHYSGGRNMTVVSIDRISYRGDPIFEHLYLGMPWTEIDYLMAANTCVPLYKQLKKDYPEVQAVNAMYTHGLVVIVSTKKRYGGFAKAVGMRVLTLPHGLGYAATVIVVDDDVDPFNLPQAMWALSTKMNPAGDLIQVPNLPVLALAPQADTPGIVDKLIIDATTPVAPDNRGNYDNQVHDLPEMGQWLTKLQQLAANR